MKTETLLDRLSRLSAQRTARTDRLHEAVQALLAKLDAITEDGDCVSLARGRIERRRVHSNVGEASLWFFRDVALERDVGSEGYLHGDFQCPLTGPTRGDLLAFAKSVPELVQQLVEAHEAEVSDLASAQGQVRAAAEMF